MSPESPICAEALALLKVHAVGEPVSTPEEMLELVLMVAESKPISNWPNCQ